MSKSEKKLFSVQVMKESNSYDYMILYNIIVKNQNRNAVDIKKEFLERKPLGSFDVAVRYLYEKIMNSLLEIQTQDVYIDMIKNIGKALMLHNRSMFQECFDLLESIIQKSQYYENNEILIIALKLYLEYLLGLGFPDKTEQEIYHYHYMQNMALKKIRKIIEQSSLHNLLVYRTLYSWPKQKNIKIGQNTELNDLIVNELFLASSDADNSFEIIRNHKLFQASCLIESGNYQTAINVYKELNLLFESNQRFWANPPIYYLSVLEGVLKGLRSVRKYDEMSYYLTKIDSIADSQTVEFGVNATCVSFLYRLFPFIDKGDFDECKNLINQYKESLFDKISMLSTYRKSELYLYLAIIDIGQNKFKAARKNLDIVYIDHNLKYLPIMRIIRLVRLIIWYELKEYDLVQYESRSIFRNNSKEFRYDSERLLLGFLNKDHFFKLPSEREKYWNSIAAKIDSLYDNKHEMQLLLLFDFLAWIESKVKHVSLKTILREKFQ